MVATLSKANAARLARVSEWFAPSRFGIFYHYGLFTGGGCATDDPRWAAPLAFRTPGDFDAATPPADVVGRNLAVAAKNCGARYATLTVCHTCGGQTVLYPTAIGAFLHRTSKDYVGAFLRECRAAGVMPMLYIPCDCNNWDNSQTCPNVVPEVGMDATLYARAMLDLIVEIHSRYGDLPAGFWLDGGLPGECHHIPGEIHSLWPHAIVVANNADSLSCDDVDFGTGEELAPGVIPDPPYNRPDGYRKLNAWGCTLPRVDFNEDIPSPSDWWFHGGDGIKPTARIYADDRFFLLRQMVCALGQRGLWNFHPGIGPRIDGTVPDGLHASLNAIRDFLSWAGEAVFNTRGPSGSPLFPGWMNVGGSIAFCSITRRLDDPNVFYAIFTEAPDKDFTMLETSGLEPRRITDLRSGRECSFDMCAGPMIRGVDWGDVAECGAKVFRVEF